jgi:PIN domain nuclease of toxin-antitoxin system
MNVLLDTCTFLWLIEGSSKLSAIARMAFQDPSNTIHLSVVSAWEIAIKHALRRLVLADRPERLVPSERARHGIESLPLEEHAVLHVGRLPAAHADPFDRMLVSQALAHGMVLLTPDPLIQRYPVRTLW